MVLTPDQKRRIAELAGKPSEKEEREDGKPSLANRLKAGFLTARASRLRSVLRRLFLLGLVAGVAGYFVFQYQLHRIDFRRVLGPGPGNPVDRLVYAVKLQKQKVDMVAEGHSQFLVGDYKMALETASAVARMDPKDSRAQNLIDLAADAATQRANKEYDLGEMEAALADVRLALRYRPEHREAKELSLRIAERLLREAQMHHGKNEYAQLIKKAQEVVKINPSEMRALNLLRQTNSELLSSADELFINGRYFEAAEKVRLALQIDPTNTRARRLLDQMSLYIEKPQLKLRGLPKVGDSYFAIIQMPHSSEPVYLKEGDTVRNFKVIHIDAEAKSVKLLQIYTKQKFVIRLPEPG